MSNIALDPLLPLPLLLALGLMILGFGLWSIMQSSRAVWFRLIAAFLVLASLFNPQIMQNDTRALKDIALVLVDQSPSQQLEKRQQQSDMARAYLEKEGTLYQDLELRFITITTDGKEDKLGTRALSLLRQTISGIDPQRYAGTVLISDGQIHDVKDYENIPGPFHLLITGQKQDQDRRIEVINAPRYGLVGKPLNLQVRVLDNAKPNDKAPLFLIKPDGSKQTFTPSGKDGIQEATFIMDHAGQSVLILETEPLKGEISLSNNRAALSINGVRDRLRVLLVSGLPHQGQRTWRNILRSDPAVDLVHFTILRPSDKEDFTPLNELSLIAFPVRELFEEKLDDFDLIIFDRYYKHNVLSEGYFDNITDYVRDGGALLVSAGPDFSGPRSLSKTRLKELLPLKPSGSIQDDRPFRLKKSQTGKRHPITTRLNTSEKDWGRWMRLIQTHEFQGQTILESEDKQPVLIVERVEKGRLAMLLSDHIWLWARGFDGGGPHSELVRNLVHWLMKEPDLEEERLSLTQVSETELEITRQSLTPIKGPITLTRPDESREEITLKAKGKGLSSSRIQAKATGIYRVNDDHYSAVLTKGSINPKEFLDPRASDQPLKEFITHVGGTSHWLADGLPLLKRVAGKSNVGGRGWFGLPRNKAEAIIGVKKSSLLPPWAIFLLVCGLLCLGWWRESR
ncbi:conserved membrane hypothetical protein [Candidatus Terasakiella magnetica]|uniref:DUF7408 domain-containing protein n=1 Tax=Candidatus Terasakiella magnetica TaxID=1867952 RepID=A0A1C3RLX3_9PROT|nr:hypothetical protein [Candidatus Terasakiella magnetica]SCA58218.1 conserved membrane hypothetical protein [Candidatus Terasakiella magnetica]